jgi:hypothetical protein
MKDPARMARQPSQHLGVLVGGIVVEHCMDQLAGCARGCCRATRPKIPGNKGS